MPRSNRQRNRKKSRIKFIQRAPGHKGKEEVRFFGSLEDVRLYVDRNTDRLKR